MARLQINGDLASQNTGISNYAMLEKTIEKVILCYREYLGYEPIKDIDLYIDNATQDSGYTPIITSVLDKILVIKLGIDENASEGKIIFQFAHEFMHYIFYTWNGLNRIVNAEREEPMCVAASLIILYHLCFDEFAIYNEYVKSLKDRNYQKGAEVAQAIGYDFGKFIKFAWKENGGDRQCMLKPMKK